MALVEFIVDEEVDEDAEVEEMLGLFETLLVNTGFTLIFIGTSWSRNHPSK